MTKKTFAQVASKPSGTKVKKSASQPINKELKSSGVMRLSHGRMFHKRGLWHIEKWRKENEKKPSDKKPKKSTRVVEKTVGGDKNGKTRKVRVARFPKSYPTEDKARKLRTNAKAFSQHKHSLRPSITPGTVLILVAGRHAGKRVVFLKQLKSGLLLVSGPFKLNGCPLRRINQIYVIATSTKVDISSLSLPESLNDSFFNRIKDKKQKPVQGSDLFEVKKEKYTVNEERKKAQVEVDKQLLALIKASPEKRLLRSYLKAKFALSNKMYPHKLKF